MTRHLITGGAGFIGSALAHRLVAEGHQVTVLDRFSRGKAERVPTKALQIKGDIRDSETVLRAVKAADTIWHLAYVQGTQTFYADPKDVIDVALRGIMNVLRSCEFYADDPKDLILVSSSEVYQIPPAAEPLTVTQEMLNLRGPASERLVREWAGRLRAGMFPTDETVPLSVPDVTNSRYSYGGGKIACEIATLAYSQADLLGRAVIVRPHNIYGPDMGVDHVIPQFALRMKELVKVRGTDFHIQGTGQETRSFCFIDDCIDGLMALYEEGEDRNVYHLGNPAEEWTIEELAHLVARGFNTTVKVVPGELPKGSPTRRLPSIDKLVALGFDPKVGLFEGLEPTLEWYAQDRAQVAA